MPRQQAQTGTVPGKLGMGHCHGHCPCPNPLSLVLTSTAEVCYPKHLQGITSMSTGQAGRVELMSPKQHQPMTMMEPVSKHLIFLAFFTGIITLKMFYSILPSLPAGLSPGCPL